jgi:hypothetical protein
MAEEAAAVPANMVNVDGKEYNIADISEKARNIIANIQFTDQELNRLRLQNAALQTARQAYITGLKKELEGGEEAADASE